MALHSVGSPFASFFTRAKLFPISCMAPRPGLAVGPPSFRAATDATASFSEWIILKDGDRVVNSIWYLGLYLVPVDLPGQGGTELRTRHGLSWVKDDRLD
jgi:hypothetical protein